MHDTTSRPHITVVGDLILDRYLIGDATKLNPEQPGVVVRVDREEDRLGGAAAVAMIAAGLGARVTLASVQRWSAWSSGREDALAWRSWCEAPVALDSGGCPEARPGTRG